MDQKYKKCEAESHNSREQAVPSAFNYYGSYTVVELEHTNNASRTCMAATMRLRKV